MKNRHRYPVFLNLSDIVCLVVGGGAVATRKVKALRRAGASVCVVSPEVSPSLCALSEKALIQWIAKPYAPRYLRGMRLVIAATDDAVVNHRVYTDAEQQGILVNVVDDLDYCRFIAPAQCTAGNLEIAVTTGGAAPVIAQLVRDDIAENVVRRYAPAVAALGSRRNRIRKLSPEAKQLFWKTVLAVVSGNQKNTGKLIRKIDAALAAAQSRTL